MSEGDNIPDKELLGDGRDWPSPEQEQQPPCDVGHARPK